MDDGLTDVFNSSLSRLSSTGVTPSNFGGRASKGMTSDEMKMVGAGIGAAADIGTTILGGVLESGEKKRAAALDKEETIRQIERNKEKQKKKNALDKQSLEAQEEEAAYKTWIERQNLRHTMYAQRLKQRIEGRQKLISGFEKLKQSTSKNADIRNAILSSFRR